jgi:hypothetical protein
MFSNTSRQLPSAKINDLRMTMDPSAIKGFTKYETGYAFFFVLKIPTMLSKLATTVKPENSITGIDYKSEYGDLINKYVQILEKEFRGLDGIENITSESTEYSGRADISSTAITKTIEVYDGTISLHYTEPYGAIITKVHELFLKGLDDPSVGRRKTYNGLIDDGILYPSYKNEVFEFLYIITDKTGYNLEKAFYIFNAQPTTSHLGELYNIERGEYGFKELTCEYKCNMVSGAVVNEHASQILEALTGYKVNRSDTGDTLVQTCKPYFDMYSPDNSDYYEMDSTQSDRVFGSLTKNDIKYMEARRRQLGETDSDSSKTDDNTSSKNKTSTKTTTVKVQDGDGDQQSAPTWSTPVAINSAQLKVNDIVVLNKSSAGYSNYLKSVKIARTNSNPSTIYGVVTSVLNKAKAQNWADQNGAKNVYGRGSKLAAYEIKYFTGNDKAVSLWFDLGAVEKVIPETAEDMLTAFQYIKQNWTNRQMYNVSADKESDTEYIKGLIMYLIKSSTK